MAKIENKDTNNAGCFFQTVNRIHGRRLSIPNLYMGDVLEIEILLKDHFERIRG
jgi:hypothetical protein